MKRLLISILLVVFSISLCIFIGCQPSVKPEDDVFAILDVEDLTRGSYQDISFSDPAECDITYTYDTDSLLIADGKITALKGATLGEYVVTASNGANSATFIVKVVGDNLSLTLKNNQYNAPFGFDDYVKKGSTVSLFSKGNLVETSTVGNDGEVSFVVESGNYVLSIDGYKDVDIPVYNEFVGEVVCDYLTFSNKNVSLDYINNGFITVDSSIDFADTDVVYAEMVIYAPQDIATTKNGEDVGGTFFEISTDDFLYNGNTKNIITFGGHWNNNYYRLRWGNERWTGLKDLDATQFANLLNPNKGLKIAVAVHEGLAYAYAEKASGQLELIGVTGGQVTVKGIKGISANLSAKVSSVKYSTKISSVKINSVTLSTSLKNKGSFALSSTGLKVSGNQTNGYTLSCDKTGAVSQIKAVQSGYYDLTKNAIISFDFNYTVVENSKYYPEISFNDSVKVQLCVYNGLLTLKYNGVEVATNANFNNGVKEGNFNTKIAFHADNDGYLAIYLIEDGETLLYSTSLEERPFKFDLIRKVDVIYQADKADDWSINNFKISLNRPTASVTFTPNAFITYDKTFSKIAYGTQETFTLTAVDNYVISTIRVDGVSIPFEKTATGYSAKIYKYDASYTHVITVEGYFPPSDYQFKSSDLAKYKIIYDADEEGLFSFANQLQSTIFSKYGVNISVSNDENTEISDYEILIGDTNRFATTGNIMKYSLTVAQNKVKINVGGVFSASKAIDYLTTNLFTGVPFELNVGEYFTTSLISTVQSITSGTTARIMSANMLADAFDGGSYKDAEYRAEIFAGVLVAYKPDVIGTQETDDAWNSVLDRYLNKVKEEYGLEYSRYFATYQNKINYTSLMYRSDKFTVTASGVKVFSWWVDPNFNHSYHMRNVSWAQFSSIDNASKKFIVANTHWSYRTEHDGGNKYLTGSSKPIATNELRTQCKDETNALLSTLKSTYDNMPIFLTGDFNTSLPYFTNYGWLNSSYSVVSAQAKSQGTSVKDVPTSGHFDHIMGTGSYTVKRFDFFTNVNFKELVSDHPFVYADLAF